MLTYKLNFVFITGKFDLFKNVIKYILYLMYGSLVHVLF